MKSQSMPAHPPAYVVQPALHRPMPAPTACAASTSLRTGLIVPTRGNGSEGEQFGLIAQQFWQLCHVERAV